MTGDNGGSGHHPPATSANHPFAGAWWDAWCCVLGLGAAMSVPRRWQPARDVGGTLLPLSSLHWVRGPLLFQNTSLLVVVHRLSLCLLLGFDSTGSSRTIVCVPVWSVHSLTHPQVCHQSTNLTPFRPFTYPLISSLIHQSTHPFICLPAHPSHLLTSHSFIYWSICPPMHSFILPYTHPRNSLLIHFPVYPST